MDVYLLVPVYGALSVAMGLWSRKRGHGFSLGFWYSFLLTPAIGFLTIALAAKVVYVETAMGLKRSCPHCFGLTSAKVLFCDVCGRHLFRQTVKQYVQLAELFVGLVLTVLLVRSIM